MPSMFRIAVAVVMWVKVKLVFGDGPIVMDGGGRKEKDRLKKICTRSLFDLMHTKGGKRFHLNTVHPGHRLRRGSPLLTQRA
jgi:hypothetical protein